MPEARPSSPGVVFWVGFWLVLAIGGWLYTVAPEWVAPGKHDLSGILHHGLNSPFLLVERVKWDLLHQAVGILTGAYWLGGLSLSLGIAFGLDHTSSLKPILVSIGCWAGLPGVAYVVIPWLANSLGIEVDGRAPYLLYWLACLAGGALLAFLWLRHGVSQMELLGKRLTRRSTLERNQRTDVRNIHQVLPAECGDFDPLAFIDEVRGLFIGLDEARRPLYISTDDWRLSHVLLSGRTRWGKGVAAQTLLVQAIRRHELVVVLDPKFDAWLPHVLHRESNRTGQPYRFLDLRLSAHPQINPFQGCDAETVENMLVAAFSLAEKGEAADFYRLKDRRAARLAASFVAENPNATARDLMTRFGKGWVEEAEGFLAAIQEMAELPSVNRADGLGVDIEALERSGGCLYVVGDMGNTSIVRMQRMLLVRLMMLAKKRDSLHREPRTITVFADEFKVHISRPFMTSLGAAAGWGMHCILAFQSLQDLADVPADLDKDVVRGAVMENCAVQFSYAIKDPETATWLAASTGTILVDDESRRIKKNLVMTETMTSERMVRQAERYLVDTNMLMNLPKGCGLLARPGMLPAFCYTSPIRVERSEKGVCPTNIVEDETRLTPADLIDI